MKKMNSKIVTLVAMVMAIVSMFAIPAFAGSVDCDYTYGQRIQVLEDDLAKSMAAENAQASIIMDLRAQLKELMKVSSDPFTYDENGIPVSIDFEDALELLKVEVSTGKFAYRIGTGIDIKVIDEVDLVSMKPYVDEYFMFAHADWSAYSFTGITSDGAMGTFTLGDANGKVYPYYDLGSNGYTEKSTEKLLGGTSDLALCLGAAMRAYQTESGEWLLCLAANGAEYQKPAKQATEQGCKGGQVEIVTQTVYVNRDRVVEKEVPGETVYVDRVVEKEVPGETVYVDRVVEKEVPGETVYVDRVVEKEVPGQTVYVDRIVEKEVPGETVYVDRIVEKEVIVYRDRPTPGHNDDNNDDDPTTGNDPTHNDKNNNDDGNDDGYDEPEVINDGGNAVEEVEKTLDELNNGSHNEGNNDYDEPEVVDDGGNAIEEVEKTHDELNGNHNGNNDDDVNVNHNSSSNEDNDVTSPDGSAIDAVQKVIPDHNGNNDD